MKKIAFLSDIHLNFLKEQQTIEFVTILKNSGVDAFVISGDIGDKSTLQYDLNLLEQQLQSPIYFVLGNHDFYGSSIAETRKNITKQCKSSVYLRYLSNTSYDMLDPTTAILGHDCWYDGGYGDAKNSTMLLNDWRFIEEFASVNALSNKTKRLELMQKLTQESIEHLFLNIKAATRYAKKIIVVSHPPPFVEVTQYNGNPSSNDSLPWFACRALGDMLKSAAISYPNIQFLSLSGHTHSGTKAQIMNNLQSCVAHAVYTKPEIQFVLDI